MSDVDNNIDKISDEEKTKSAPDAKQSGPKVVNESAEEDALWKELYQTKSTKIRDKFIRQYMPLVKYVAGKVIIGMPGNVEYDDLVSFGQFGLLDAITKYDASKGVKFKTYAVTRIRGAIYDELRQIDWVPRSIRQKAREIETTVAALEARLGRNASDEEIAQSLNISVEEYHKTMMKVARTSVISLNDVWHSSDDNESISIADTIEAPTSLNPDTIIEREEKKLAVERAIKELPEKERLVIMMYYLEDLTFKEIGQVLDVCESRVSQLHSKANMHLKAKLTNIRKGIV